MLVYCVKFSINVGSVDVRVDLLGPLHSVFIVTSTFTCGFNITVQVRFGEDPAKIMSVEAVTVTETGAGTEWN